MKTILSLFALFIFVACSTVPEVTQIEISVEDSTLVEMDSTSFSVDSTSVDSLILD